MIWTNLCSNSKNSQRQVFILSSWTCISTDLCDSQTKSKPKNSYIQKILHKDSSSSSSSKASQDFQSTGSQQTLNMGHCLQFRFNLLGSLTFACSCHAFSHTHNVITGVVWLLLICSNQCPQLLQLELSGPLTSERQ